jgi:hypothetical protein
MHASAICFPPWTKICSLILRYQECNKPLHTIINPFLHSMIIHIRNVKAVTSVYVTDKLSVMQWICDKQVCAMAHLIRSLASHCNSPGLIPGWFMSELEWIKWCWDTCLSEYFSFPFSLIPPMPHTVHSSTTDTIWCWQLTASLHKTLISHKCMILWYY